MNNPKRSAAMRAALLPAALAAMIILSGCGAPPSPSGDTEGVEAQGTLSMGYTDSPSPKCDFCHTDRADAPTEEYNASRHSLMDSATYNATGAREKCSKCHTGDGAKLYLNNTPSELSSKYYIPGFGSPITCDTCHDPHGNKDFLKDAGTDILNNTASGQYKTCTTCHDEENATHGEGGKYSYSGGIFDPIEVIYDTHFDNAATGGIEGYVINSAASDACSACHTVHSIDNTINNEWAHSGHGGFITEVKEQAFQNAPGNSTDHPLVTAVLDGTDGYGAMRELTPNYNAPAWVHYDFKNKYGSCKRCHTATGFRKFANNPDTYKAPSPSEYFATGLQKEMLYCWACHTSVQNSVAFRDPGAMQYSMADLNSPQNDVYEGRIVNVPDLGGSNVCIACHSGRKIGAQVKAMAITNGLDFTKIGYSHTSMAAATLLRVGGYENGLSPDYYDNYSYFAHDLLGDAISIGGSNGPCVSCHMKGTAGHTMEAVTLDGAGDIIGIPTYGEVCSFCHAVEFPTEAQFATHLNNERADFEDALVDLEAALLANGIGYTSRPYFKTADLANTIGKDPYYWTNKDVVGIATNFYLLKHEPGAYAHNSRYTKRLLYDAFDFLDNYAGYSNTAGDSSYLDGSVDVNDFINPAVYDYLGGVSGRP
jgi:hypothetical protein